MNKLIVLLLTFCVLNTIAEDATEGKKDGGKVGKAKQFGFLRSLMPKIDLKICMKPLMDFKKYGCCKSAPQVLDNSALDVCADNFSPLRGLLPSETPPANPGMLAMAMQANVASTSTKIPQTGVVYSLLRKTADVKAPSATTVMPDANKSSKLSATLKKTGSAIVSSVKKVVKQLPTSKSRKTRNSDFLSLLGLSGSGSNIFQGLPGLNANPKSDADPLKDIQDNLASILGKPLPEFGSPLSMGPGFPMTGEQLPDIPSPRLPWISSSGFPTFDSGLFPRGIMGTYDANGNINVASVTTAFLANITDTTWQGIVTEAIKVCAADVAAFDKSSIPASTVLANCKPDAKLFISCFSKEINLKCPDFNSAVSRCASAKTDLEKCDAHIIALPPPSFPSLDGIDLSSFPEGIFPPGELPSHIQG